ncbi:hypothetical protein BCR43DRAFT_483399 [Syncephalastrum racemosum]|uniref:BZIP domain-containing protein n=1 Tax=Syncephalastrum racemosum TaxID=13706 RepID=A0A1X2HV58_SYNRA|nr:hypothetical protein BCR43DRAFT_483399 [Syncephalastrum racemosum]
MTIAATSAPTVNDSIAVSTTRTAPDRNKSPIMAVLPLDPSAKLDQEPNPFEQSFSSAATKSPNTAALADKLSARSMQADGRRNGSQCSNTSTSSSSGASTQGRTVLPPVAALTSPAPPLLDSGILPKDISSQLAWDSLRAGPLSPSMLQRPAQPAHMENYNLTAISNPTSSVINPAAVFSQSNQPPHPHNQPTVFMNSDGNTFRRDSLSSTAISQQRSGSSLAAPINQDSGQSPKLSPQKKRAHERTSSTSRKSTRRKTSETSSDNFNDEEEEKRRNFLERNRIAALKCRQRKKQWLSNLQAKVDYLTNDNEELQLQASALREEIVNLKTLLLAHKNCPVAQMNGFDVNSVQKAALLPPSEAPSIGASPSSIAPSSISHPSVAPLAMEQGMVSFSSAPRAPTRQGPQEHPGVMAGTSSVLRF